MRIIITRVLQEHGSPPPQDFSYRATKPKCKLMLAKSPESVHKKIGAGRSSNFRVIFANSESVTHTRTYTYARTYGTDRRYIPTSPTGGGNNNHNFSVMSLCADTDIKQNKSISPSLLLSRPIDRHGVVDYLLAAAAAKIDEQTFISALYRE